MCYHREYFEQTDTTISYVDYLLSLFKSEVVAAIIQNRFGIFGYLGLA